MTETPRQQLETAYQHLKAGDKAAAVAILKPMVRADRDNADAWWLLANALDDPDKQRKALFRALDLRPDHAKAQQMLADLDAAHLPSIEALVEGDFADDAEYIEDDYWAKLEAPQPKQSNQTLYIVLGVVGVLAVLGCGACFFVFSGVTTLMEDVFESSEFAMLVDEIAAYENFDTSYNDGSSVSPANARYQGVIEPGQTRTGTVHTMTDDLWTFTASAGEHVTIELNTLDYTLDPVLYVFDSQDILLYENDDGGPDLNSLLETTLPYTGSYSIVVSAFDVGGDYELRLITRAAL